MVGPTPVDRRSSALRHPGVVASALALALVIAAIIIGVRSQGWLEVLELEAYDRALGSQGIDAPESRSIVLVTVTEADIQGLARWPLSDTRLATLIDAVASQGPVAIGLDIFRDQPVGEGLARLEDTFARHPEVVAVFSQPTPSTLGVPPPPSLADDPSRIGFANVILDGDGKVRRGLLLMGDERHGAVYSLPSQLALRFLARQGIQPTPDPVDPTLLRLGKGTVNRFRGHDGAYVSADDGEYQFLLDGRTTGSRFETIDMWSVLEGNAPEALFTDRVVLIGVTAESVKDEFLRPGMDGPVFGVELQAQVVTQLLHMAATGNEPPRPIPDWVEQALIVILALLGVAAGILVQRSAAFLIVVSAVVAGLWGLGVLGMGRELWIPVVPPMIAWLCAAMTGIAIIASFERRERANIYRLFSRFCSQEVVDEIRYQGGDLLAPGESTSLPTTIMFTDIVGFSTKAEELGPYKVMTWLNGYAAAMMPLVYAERGIVLRLIGDAIQAVYGAPVPRNRADIIEANARRAVRTALAMDKALLEYNRTRASDTERVTMRIGIASGTVAGGVLGNDQRQEYNVHGDVVNIAARLEQLEKERFEDDYFTNRTRILVTRDTLQLLGDEFETEFYAELKLRNLDQSTRVYLVIGPAGTGP